MHHLQQKILDLAQNMNLEGLGYRSIGKLVGEAHPQKISHHINQLIKKGFLNDKYQLANKSDDIGSNLISIPILGSARAGSATMVAEERIEGFLKISKSLLKKHTNIFALKAEGDSMNQAEVGKEKRAIKNGDYVIVDRSITSPEENDIVISVIDGYANIKEFHLDKENEMVVLVSRSDKSFPPIFIDPEQSSFYINGKVIQVIKNSY